MHDLSLTLSGMAGRDEKRGEHLRALRQRKGLSQETVARRLEVTSKTVWSWERGSGIHPDNLHAVAELYEVDVEELQSHVEIPSPFKLRDYIGEELGPFRDWIAETSERLDEQDGFMGEILEALRVQNAAIQRNAEALEGLRTYLQGLSLVRLAEQAIGQDDASEAGAPSAAPRAATRRRQAG